MKEMKIESDGTTLFEFAVEPEFYTQMDDDLIQKFKLFHISSVVAIEFNQEEHERKFESPAVIEYLREQGYFGLVNSWL